MTTTINLTETAVKQLVTDWYQKLDVHAPIEELLPLLAKEGLEMRLPETTLHNEADFTNWYNVVTHKFFNETHTMKKLDVRVTPEQAEVELVVNWQAYIWNAPAANSQWIGFDATQSWVVKKAPEDNHLIVVFYAVVAFVPMPGSPEL